MTAMELDYLQRAVVALASHSVTDADRAKILRTMAQICGKCATELDNKMVDTLAI